MKKIIAGFIAFSLLFCFSFCVNATNDYRLFDGANLLTESEEEELLKSINEYSDKLGFEIIILTTSTLGLGSETDTGSFSFDYLESLAQTYCEDYYDNYVNNKNGIVFLRYVNNYDRYMRIATFGDLRGVFTEDKNDKIFDEIEGYLDPYSTQAYTGFSEYLPLVEKTYNTRNSLTLQSIVISLIIALVIALIIVMKMKGELKSVKNQDNATSYLKKGSFKLTNSNDVYLYKTVSKTRVQSSSSGKRSGGGGRSGGSGRRR